MKRRNKQGKLETDIIVCTVECEYLKKTLQYTDAVTAETIDILHINIKYPCIVLKNPEDKQSLKNTETKINDFYYQTAKNYLSYSENKFYKEAIHKYLLFKKARQDGLIETYEKFKPFGALLTFCVTHNKDNALHIYLDATLYTGKDRGKTDRFSHLWSLPDCSVKRVRRGQDDTGVGRARGNKISP